jgi:hypothetical protein
MALFTYTLPGTTDGITAVLYVDPDCTVPATLTALNGAPIPGSIVSAGQDGISFQSASGVLYRAGEDGVTSRLDPELNFDAPGTVTGSKGANAALASLITQLIAIGLPLVDQTS